MVFAPNFLAKASPPHRFPDHFDAGIVKGINGDSMKNPLGPETTRAGCDYRAWDNRWFSQVSKVGAKFRLNCLSTARG